jgi:hypothetical protein
MENVEEDAEDEQAWDKWLVESDSHSSSGESEWINVVSDGSNNIEINDSGSETTGDEHGSARSDEHKEPPRISSFATTKVGGISPISYEVPTNID